MDPGRERERRVDGRAVRHADAGTGARHRPRSAASPDRHPARAGRAGRGAAARRSRWPPPWPRSQAQVDDLAGRQRQLEEQIAASAKRRHDIEERMRSGAGLGLPRPPGHGPRGPAAGRRARRQLEDEEIVLLEEEEPLDIALADAPAEAAALEAEARPARRRPSPGRGRDRAPPSPPRRPRGPNRPPGSPPTWPSGTSVLRSQLGGVGAARLVGDRCDGCHLTLPSVEVERIRRLPRRRVRHLPPVRPDPGPLSRSTTRRARPVLILVRHGESTGNADGLLLGRIDAPLTERGLAQARTLARRWPAPPG